MAKKHTHKYHRVDTDAGSIWACGLPECNHFMPVHYTKLLPGKWSICWECQDPFILTEQNMRASNPICPNCSTLSMVVAGAFGVNTETE